MKKTLGMTELKRKFYFYFEAVVHKGAHLIISRNGRPEAALIPYDEYLRLQQIQEREVLAGFNRVWDRISKVNTEFSEAEIRADIESARRK